MCTQQSKQYHGSMQHGGIITSLFVFIEYAHNRANNISISGMLDNEIVFIFWCTSYFVMVHATSQMYEQFVLLLEMDHFR